MKRMLLAFTIFLATADAVTAKEVWERPWVEVRSEHFVLASGLSEERTLQLATELENFRSAVDLLTGGGEADERIPTKIYVLPRAEKALGFTGALGGYFHPGMRANYAVMIPSGSYSDDILKHEYTHYLNHRRDERRHPRWLEEGLAEVFSTLRVDGSIVEFGRVPEARVQNLVSFRWLKFERLLDKPQASRMTGEQTAMFYAQSWLLVHFLMVGRGSDDFSADLASYLQRLESGEAPLAAFEAAFGIEMKALDNRLVDYGNNLGFFRLSLKDPVTVSAMRTRAMPVDEVAAALGTLALLRGNLEGAQEFYEGALAENPDNANALIGMADLHKFAKRYEEAVPLYERALALEPNVAEHLLDYGEYFLERAEAEESPEPRRQLLVEARRQFARSYELDPNNPETLDQNGLTYLFAGEDAARGLQSLELAHALLPSHDNIQVDLARAYAATGDMVRARDLLEELLATSHPERAEQIEKLLADMSAATAGDAP